MESFFSSFYVDEELILFHANDYTLYAFDKKSGAQSWSQYMHYKTSVPPAVVGERVIANGDELVLLIDRKTGSTTDTIPASSMYTEPFIRENTLYATGIEEAGCVYAYDLQTSRMVWSKFIAHGCMEKPYYFKDHLYANTEGSWIKLSYDGSILNCKDTTSEVLQSKCREEFVFITHDGYKVSEEQVKKVLKSKFYNPGIVSRQKDVTVVIPAYERTILVLGKKAKKVALLNLDELIPEDYNEDMQVIKVEGNTLWFFYNYKLFAVDFVSNKVVSTVDFTAWEPSSFQQWGNEYWLISKKDGLLYGLR